MLVSGVHDSTYIIALLNLLFIKRASAHPRRHLLDLVVLCQNTQSNTEVTRSPLPALGVLRPVFTTFWERPLKAEGPMFFKVQGLEQTSFGEHFF